MGFPSGFVWGASTASYQIEGGAEQDGRGLSVWDTFSRTPGMTWQGHTGDVACDFYNRWRDDLGIMKRIGIRAFRMSLSWSRIMPEGVGSVNEKGLDFYSRLVDGLLEAGVEPYVTLFHWDYPQALYERGGWLNRETVKWFEGYSEVVAKRLGDRVSRWMTLNEPQVFCKMGHSDGVHAPGRKMRFDDVLLTIHHSLMSHGAAVRALRGGCKKTPLIGWAPVCVTKIPVDPRDPSHVEAAREATFDVLPNDAWNNSWYYDPVIFGEYPAAGLKAYGKHVPKVHAGDMELMKQPIDWIGVNIYNGLPVRPKKAGEGLPAAHERERDVVYLAGEKWIAPGREVGHALTAFRWTVDPISLYWGPRFIAERYKLPVYITENGLSSMDWECEDGKVHDPQRIDFTRRYLKEVRRAIADGVDIRGYLHWSLFDNYEWSEGYKERFGLVFVDYPTQRRILKDSAHWYSRVIGTNGASLEEDPFVRTWG